ncbi:MAG: B12-binding domain-containing radical SAM protein [Bacillota bacterium]|jgi:radical SAM superfamily enzyme YgiQ (UPF0313 family)
MRYEGNIFRPPSEAYSFLLQCTVGCSYNKCTFCYMYKDKKFRIRNIDEIKTDIRMAKLYYGPEVQKVFLCDGDALCLSTESLVEIIQYLYANFPHLKHVGAYAGPHSILRKSIDELKKLKEAGLTIGYLGVETGNDKVLKQIKKGVTAEEMREAGMKFRKAGMKLSTMVILGIAGRGEDSLNHARDTGKILSEIDPEYAAALTLRLKPGTELTKQATEGIVEIPNQWELLQEMKEIVVNMNVSNCVFRSNHASNHLPVKGHLPEDKEQLLVFIDEIIKCKDDRYIRPEFMREL